MHVCVCVVGEAKDRGQAREGGSSFARSRMYISIIICTYSICICIDIRTFGGGEDPAGIYILHYIYIHTQTNEGRPTGFQQCAQRFNDVSTYIYVYRDDIM